MFRFLCALLLIGIVTARIVRVEERFGYKYHNKHEADDDGDGEENNEDDDEGTQLPKSNFNCTGKIDGFYADVELKCRVYHYCQTFNLPGNRTKRVDWEYLCPDTTIFNQELLTCTSEDETPNCQDSADHFDVNENLTQTPPSVSEVPEQPTNPPLPSSTTSTSTEASSTTPSPPPPIVKPIFYYSFRY